MKVRTHKFKQNGMHILVDVNSGAVHVIDEMIYDMMDDFDGTNDEAVVAHLAGRYSEADLREACGELHELMAAGALFAPDIDVPPTFKSRGLVKSLCLMVAQDCNLRCKYCFGDGGSYGGHRAVMSPEVGRAAVDFIINGCGPRKHCEIDFFGGEPLMNLGTVKEVTAYVRRREQETGKEFKLTLTTNGMLLSDKNIAWLNDNNISVVLSSDGRREVHDAMRPDVRGNGSYDVVMRNFKKLVDARHGNDYYLRGTYTRENLDFTKDVLAMNEAGFDILSMEPVVLKDSPLGFTEEDLPRIFAEYDHLTETYLSRVRAGKGFFFFHFNMDLNHGPCVAKRLAGCGAGHEYYAVAENGDLYPCHQFVGREGYRLGSVFTGVESMELPTYFRNSHVLNKPLCRDCWARFYCSGGCHANADLFHGDIRHPYELGCEIQKKRLECAILVQAVLALEQEAEEETQEEMRKRA
ncbi:MAG: thioether cross-link-forming SCIFF peptide maturase [Centipeda sp. (in: firmicutes)]|uniref:thioether cross-link-forming SCIFF peptide maturase n=1 Tax=Selenomonas sp. oral taxon 920 TaxID=1884263 RepID=UPI000840DF0B|nr:thioether cross-link-forming SCIFF peptide maturase [Selenomonas sp. oral taxon 920]AOH47209.1 thioether cross-link-forming SCIFF peptide maturase [Selenomonas sp. oral taxon 920]